MENEKSPLLLHHPLLQKVAGKNEGPIRVGSIASLDPPAVGRIEDPSSSSTCLSQAWLAYNNQLDKQPLLVKCITAFFVLGLGDMCGQGVEHARGTAIVDGVDWIRAIRFGLFGLLGAPWAHYYFYYLDHYLPPTEAPCTPTTALKLAIDQGLQAPALLAVIISALAIMKGTGWAGIKYDMISNYWEALVLNCKSKRKHNSVRKLESARPAQSANFQFYSLKGSFGFQPLW